MYIEADRLTYAYGSGDGTGRPALREISFGFGRGTCLGVIGGPGAGKSTLARLLAGLLAPTGGRLDVAGATAAGDRESRRRLAALVGYVPQWPERQLFARTVGEDVAAGLTRGRGLPPHLLGRVEEAMARAGLDPGLLDRPIPALSGAQARKAALAGVLVLDRPVLVLDEPTAALDPLSRKNFTALVERLKREGKTVVIISHRLSDLLPVADRLLVLREGEMIFHGATNEAAGDEPLAASGALEWPPMLELMLRLRKHVPDFEPFTNDTDEAWRRIKEALGHD